MLTIAGDVSSFNIDAFCDWLAALLHISPSRILVRTVSIGSVVTDVVLAEDPSSNITSSTALSSLQSLYNSNDPSITQGTFAVSKVTVIGSSSTSTTGTPFTHEWYFYLIIAACAVVLIVVVVIIVVVRKRKSKQVGHE